MIRVAVRAWKYGIQGARKWVVKVYPNHKFARETVRNWRARYQTFFNELITSTEGSTVLFSLPRLGRRPTLSDHLTTEIKQILNNLRIAGCAISRKAVISIGNGVLAAKSPEKLPKNGGSITLPIKWARNLLKSMDWVKKRHYRKKRDMNLALYDELVFAWKKKIAEAVFEHKIPSDLTLNFDQTPLGFASP